MTRLSTDSITSETELDNVLTEPRPILVDWMSTLQGPLMILGAGGKMGPSLSVLARRAADEAGNRASIIGVSRFSSSRTRDWLEARGVRTIACDLMSRQAVNQLPDAPNVIYLVGRKFGTTDDPSITWATNTLPPYLVTERYAESRIVALSTGNVYPLVNVTGPGSRETDPLTPTGEYANSCVARERIFEYCSHIHQTAITILRLSYALDLRYGVLVDIAQRVRDGAPIDVTMGYANAIWQGDANEMILRSLDLARTPPHAVNLTGPRFSVRQVANRFGELLSREPQIVGSEAETAYLSDTTLLQGLLGKPATTLDTVIDWTAYWIAQGKSLLDKPTHFGERKGTY